jgi:hypothetical protein
LFVDDDVATFAYVAFVVGRFTVVRCLFTFVVGIGIVVVFVAVVVVLLYCLRCSLLLLLICCCYDLHLLLMIPDALPFVIVIVPVRNFLCYCLLLFDDGDDVVTVLFCCC